MAAVAGVQKRGQRGLLFVHPRRCTRRRRADAEKTNMMLDASKNSNRAHEERCACTSDEVKLAPPTHTLYDGVNMYHSARSFQKVLS